jgi:hypothetical protein
MEDFIFDLKEIFSSFQQLKELKGDHTSKEKII